MVFLKSRNQVLECPSCGATEKFFGFIRTSEDAPDSKDATWLQASTWILPFSKSGQTYYAEDKWSDGKPSERIMQETSSLAKCTHCDGYYWITKANRRKGSAAEISTLWKRRYKENLTVSQYLEALAQGIATSAGEEIYLRVRAWWAANDSWRGLSGFSPSHTPVLPLEVILNLNRLTELLNDSYPGHLLMRAEIARELGEMDVALRILAHPLLMKCEETTRRLRAWAQAGICQLQPFTHANWHIAHTP